MSNTESKSGYYAVRLTLENERIPYIVFAESDYQAAVIVRKETGYMAKESEIEGPFAWGSRNSLNTDSGRSSF